MVETHSMWNYEEAHNCVKNIAAQLVSLKNE